MSMGEKVFLLAVLLQGNLGVRKTENKETSRYLKKKNKTKNHKITISLLMIKNPLPQ